MAAVEHDAPGNSEPTDLAVTFVLSRGETIACYRRLALRKWSLWAFVRFGLEIALSGLSLAAALPRRG